MNAPSQSSIDVPGSFPTTVRDPHAAIDHLAEANTTTTGGSDSIDHIVEMASKYLPRSVAGTLGLDPISHGTSSLPIGESRDGSSGNHTQNNTGVLIATL